MPGARAMRDCNFASRPSRLGCELLAHAYVGKNYVLPQVVKAKTKLVAFATVAQLVAQARNCCATTPQLATPTATDPQLRCPALPLPLKCSATGRIGNS